MYEHKTLYPPRSLVLDTDEIVIFINSPVLIVASCKAKGGKQCQSTRENAHK